MSRLQQTRPVGQRYFPIFTGWYRGCLAMRPMPVQRRRNVRIAGRLVILASMTAAACTLAPAALGPTPAEGGRKLDDFLASIQRTFTDVEFSPAVIATSEKLDRSTLVPSAVYTDSSMWTGSEAQARRFTLTGRFLGDHYVVMPDTAAPVELGASRRDIRLEGLTRRDFRWTTSIEQNLGPIATTDLDRAVTAIFAGAASTPGRTLRAATQTRYARAGAVLGQLVSLESVDTRQMRGMPTRLRLVMGLHVDRLAVPYPAYANALSRVLAPIHIHCVVTDADNAEWGRIDFDGARLSMDIAATRDGHLAPLVGAARPMPDSLVLHADVSTKVFMFSVGARDLPSQIEVLHADHARGWRFTFRRQPTWDFPLALDQLVKSSLARPFADGGARYEIVVSDTVGPQTILQRRGVLIVEESPIVSSLAELASAVTASFSGDALTQENAFFASVLAAIRADVRRQSDGIADKRYAGRPLALH